MVSFMGEKLRIVTKKRMCIAANHPVEIIEIYKDITDGENIITSCLTEVNCLNFRHCKHPCSLSINYNSPVKCCKPYLIQNENNIK